MDEAGTVLNAYRCILRQLQALRAGDRRDVFLRLRIIRGNLALVLVEVKGGVKLGLLHLQFLEAFLVLEWAAELFLVFGEGFLLPLDLLLSRLHGRPDFASGLLKLFRQV